MTHSGILGSRAALHARVKEIAARCPPVPPDPSDLDDAAVDELAAWAEKWQNRDFPIAELEQARAELLTGGPVALLPALTLAKLKRLDWEVERHSTTGYRNWAPARFRDADLTAAPKALRAWVEQADARENVPNLVLLGPVGTGKSWSGYGVCRHLADEASWTARPTGVMYEEVGYGGGSWADLLDRMRPDGDLVVADLLAPGLLLLDDIGAERPSDWSTEQLNRLVDARWRDFKPVIVTSNLEPSALRDHVGLRVYDRLRDGATVVTLKGASRRQSRSA